MGERKKNRLQLDDGEIELKGHSNWAVSYADMVTLLLCFFILFFNVDKNKPDHSSSKNSVLTSIKQQFDRKSKLGVPTENMPIAVNPEVINVGGGQVPEGAKVVPKDAVIKSQEISVIFDRLLKKPRAKLDAFDDQIELQIADVEFFGLGQTKLTIQGQREIEDVFEVLKPFKEKVFVEIIGHSDPTPISSRATKKFSSNLELSTLRAMTVFQVMKSMGMPSDSMVISGYSDSRPIETELAKDQVGLLRRVSFSIRMKTQRQLKRIMDHADGSKNTHH
jgi:chemotaxis protein MotB